MYSNIIFIFSVLFIFLLSGCNEENQIKNTTAPSTTQHQQVKGKSHAPVAMKFEFLDDIKLNEAIEIKLFFKAGLNTDALKVEVTAGSGVVINSAQLQYQFNNVVKNDINTLVLSVTVNQPGKHVLNVYAAIDVSGVAQARSFVVPFNIAASAASKATSNSLSKGMKYIPEQNIISMPASETTN